MLPKAYEPSDTEDRIYTMWEESGAFTADPKSKKEPFTISMPPPNATGQLHLGHAVMLALEDIFSRFARMQGKEALWVPGIDHAAIATENIVIKKLKNEGMNDPRAELGREKLLAAIRDFVAESRGTIRLQIRKMGASSDWSREAYTMDEPRSRLVREVFCKMFADGLIYRGHRIVNWDPKLQTNVSDDELEWEDRTDPFYTFRYGPFQIATVRPETKFGDKYVVVHPDDKRYKKYKHGDTFTCEWINGPITATVIKDKAVDPDVGTGAMTITPWHSVVDCEIAERHGLDKEQIIDFEGKLLPIAGEFSGMKIENAREKIVEKLKEKGLLVKVDENYAHTVALNCRGGGMIEPQIKLQWFIDVNRKAVPWKGKKMSLKQVMQDVVKSGDITIIPERFEKTYFHWIDNLRDWCISRQIWWGHRIPVFYCVTCTGAQEKIGGVSRGQYQGVGDGTFVSTRPIDYCPKCNGSIEQDSDTLDTWFSSALWTWSTLVDSKITEDYSLTLKEIIDQSPDIQKFHPTQVLETGYDIIFFWVARMILMTTYVVGDIPFNTVYLHGLIRDRNGKKMSKSNPETMIDPLEMISTYGADALRMSMIVGQSPGNDQKLYEEKIAGYRNFVNKLWNAARFVLLSCEKIGVDPVQIGEIGKSGNREIGLADRAVLHGLELLIVDCTQCLEEYRLSEAGEKLYVFIWDYFCDWYLELSKEGANPEVLIHVLRTLLVLLHPYCPFVTEELWSHVKAKNAGMLIATEWPKIHPERRDEEAYERLQRVIGVISVVRSIRAERGIESGKLIDVIIHTDAHLELLRSQREHIMRMGRVRDWTLDAVSVKHENSASAFLSGIEVHIPLEGLIDIKKEIEKLRKEKAKLEAFIKTVEGKLKNKKFVENAREDVVNLEKEKLVTSTEKLKKIEERLLSLQ